MHGPQPRDYSQRTPKKMIAAALRGALQRPGPQPADPRGHRADRRADPVDQERQDVPGHVDRSPAVLIVIGRSDEVGARSVATCPACTSSRRISSAPMTCSKADDVVFSVEALNAYIEHNTKEEVSA